MSNIKKLRRKRVGFFVRKKIIRLLCNKMVNTTAIVLLKHLSSFIPDKLITRMPIVGKVSVELPDGKYLVMETGGGDLIARDLFWTGFKGYEYETTKLFYELAKRSKVIFDIGANIGYYTLLAAIGNEGGQVFAFEPVPKIYEYLKRNIALNPKSNVIAISSAVTNFDGEITLYIPADDGIIPVSVSTLEGFRETEGEISVPAITIDSFVYKNQIEKVDLMKIDTEATEHIVLEGARHTLKRDKPIIICEVLKEKTERALEALLSDLGYKYYWTTDKGLIQKDTIEGDGTGKYRNYLFCTEDKLTNIWQTGNFNIIKENNLRTFEKR
jgi:FkbM family methyltransferase